MATDHINIDPVAAPSAVLAETSNSLAASVKDTAKVSYEEKRI